MVKHIRTMKFDYGIALENVVYVTGFNFNLILCKDLNCEITLLMTSV